jgi:hypothetical protein
MTSVEDDDGAETAANITANTADVSSVNLKFYKRDAAAELVLADPPGFLFVVR